MPMEPIVRKALLKLREKVETTKRYIHATDKESVDRLWCYQSIGLRGHLPSNLAKMS